MPFCTQCGNRVGEADLFCASCGSAQKGGPGPGARRGAARSQEPFKGLLDGMTPRKASLLCYLPVIGWIPALVALSSARFRNDMNVRFHAFQGLYLFVAWLIADWVIKPISHSADFHLEGILKAAIFVAWIFMIIKTSHNEHYRLPIFGELAERSANEQR